MTQIRGANVAASVQGTGMQADYGATQLHKTKFINFSLKFSEMKLDNLVQKWEFFHPEFF
jgi:hypothetical protein